MNYGADFHQTVAGNRSVAKLGEGAVTPPGVTSDGNFAFPVFSLEEIDLLKSDRRNRKVGGHNIFVKKLRS